MTRVLRLGLIAICAGAGLHATVIFEGFDDISTLAGAGWVIVNNSTAGGTTTWFQGNPGVFSAEAGASNSYIAANFNAAGLGGNISDWLISPEVMLQDGEFFSFWTRTETGAVPGDKLQVRISLNGASTNVGAAPGSVGDFTLLLGTVNGNNNGYPEIWKNFSGVLSGVGGPTLGRIAFRYGVVDTSTNGDFIGIDSVLLTDPLPEPGTAGLLLSGLVAGAAIYRRSRRKLA